MVAATPNQDPQRRSLINLRVTPRDRDLIDRAAAALGKTPRMRCWIAPRFGLMRSSSGPSWRSLMHRPHRTTACANC
jgi:hypothetical protein